MIADVSASADKWEKALTAFLTLFSTVAFITGPKLASDVSSPSAARFSFVVIGVALVLAFVARVRMADAAAPLPSPGPSMTAAEFGARKYAAGKHALEQLRSARSLAVGAALLIAAGALILAWASVNEPSSPAPQALIRTTTGVVCGELSTSADGVVTVAGQQIEAAEEALLDIDCNVAAASDDESDLTFPPVALALAVVAASVAGAYAGSRRSVATMLLGFLAVVVAASLYYTVSRDTPAFSEFDETWMLLAFCAAGSGLAFLTARYTGEVPRSRRPST